VTTILATTSTISTSLTELIAGANLPPAPPAADTNSNTPTPDSSDNFGAAAFVTLSEQAKQAAATKVVTDQVAADQLQAFVEARHADLANAGSGGFNAVFSADTSPAADQPLASTGGARVEAIVAQIKTLADANEPPPFQAFTPTKSLSNSVAVDGYTLTISTNASTQYYGAELSGNGVGVYDKHFGPSAGAGGGTGIPAGVEVSTQMIDNNEALAAITVSRNVASVSSASISSSSAGSTSASSVNASSSSITFLVNYATGQISVQQSAMSVSAQSTSSSPGSTLSTLA
jgi:hypothetical protein